MLDTTKLSFDDLVAQLQNVLKTQSTWSDTYQTSTGSVLVDIYGYTAQLILYYLKRVSEELFEDTAQLWTSMVRLLNMFNVPVKRPRGVSGYIKVIPKQSILQPITIPKYTVVRCDDTFFYVAEDTIVQTSDTEKLIPVRQGYRSTYSFVSNGNVTSQSYRITNENISDVDIDVKIGDTQYEVVNYLFEGTNINQVKVYTDVDKSLVINFIKGFGLPLINQSITVNVSVVDSNFQPSLNSTWYIDDTRFSASGVFPFSGNASWETVDEMRQRIEKGFSAGQRAVSKLDFWYVVKSVPGVDKVLVLDVKDMFAAPFKSVKIYVKPTNSTVLDDVLKNDIKNVLDKISLSGIDYIIEGANIVDVDVYVVAGVSTIINSEEVRTNIINKIQNMYAKVDIGEWISIERLLTEIYSVEGLLTVTVIEPKINKIMAANQLVNLRSLRVDITRG